MSPRTEFYETAVESGFYGLERSNLFGKKDNVRKYGEDIFIKLLLCPYIEKILKEKGKIRVVDLGCGSGEGVELLTHIPKRSHDASEDKYFLLSTKQIERYVGLDISPSMISQGEKNYPQYSNVEFIRHDISKGLPSLKEESFDLYFSSYSSFSHLTKGELEGLTKQIFLHTEGRAYIVFDLLGKYSPEWPKYWNKSNKEMLPYNMAYLLELQERVSEKIETFYMAFWSADELRAMIDNIGLDTGKKSKVVEMKDRSIFVGRHMDTGIFNKAPQEIRYGLNRALDRDYRGNIEKLKVDLSFIQEYEYSHKDIMERILAYKNDWDDILNLIGALQSSKDKIVKELIENSSPVLSEEMRMLAWLYRNSSRFSVVDFLASIFWPQVAIVLRNLEMSLPDGLGCGHGLFCIVEVNDSH